MKFRWMPNMMYVFGFCWGWGMANAKYHDWVSVCTATAIFIIFLILKIILTCHANNKGNL